MSFSWRQAVRYLVLDAKAATGAGKKILVRDFRNAVVIVNTTGNANFTLKAKGGICAIDSDESPDFSSAASPSNRWGYVQAVDLDDGTPVTGSTGIVSAGTDINKLYEININALDYLTLDVTAISAGAVSATVLLTSNL